MSKIDWQVRLGLTLIVASIIVYGFHFLIFDDLHHILIYLIGDIGFLPIEVLIVSLIIHRILSARERKIRLEKLNMVIGAFFSEVGIWLLAFFSDFDPSLSKIKQNLIVSNDWNEEEFLRVEKLLKIYSYTVDMGKINLKDLASYLVDKRDFMLRLLENPTLLEHESFTELLRAVFHLTEELENRKSLKNLPESDVEHLQGDIVRAYGLLVVEWLDYMRHLKENYPYLFSLAMRTNPFDTHASPIVR
ncbi:MAG: hypothetical protein ABH851_03390 [Methanobacteriota archaeon]